MVNLFYFTAMTNTHLYEEYRQRMQKIADLKYSAALLQWDQETYLPAKGHEMRARQIATLNETAHEWFTDSKTGDLLDALMATDGLTETQKRNVELSYADFHQQRKLSARFVRDMSEAVNRSFLAWIEARQASDYSLFEKPLARIIELKQQQTDMLGYENHPYNALMDEFDKGATVAATDTLFADLKSDLQPILQRLMDKPAVNEECLHRHFPKQAQWEYGLYLLKEIQFDFEAGRQDISEHPFTVNFNAQDVRLTTRIDEQDFGNMTWSCLHEGGHGLYEQGLPNSEYGLPLGEYCSLSIHESQSRFWENQVGRSLGFWKMQYPALQSHFPEQLGVVDLPQFYAAINAVKPSLIRTEADELTYHFHVLIRYELEKALIQGSLTTRDIPAAWHAAYQQYLGVTVPNDRMGCLQDVHWSHGSFGYFATYSKGSLYAAQWGHQINRLYPGIFESIGTAETTKILTWLRQHIHAHGRYYHSDELCRRITGEALNARYFIDYATQKFSDIYQIKT
jgi:carboxypeptidase Taq